MTEWNTPKTDWVTNPKNPVAEDFNRIEGNIDFLKQDIETKKGLIVDAINDMNQPAQVSDTHAQLASKIRDISDDATAAVGDVESGKTFYSGGSKKTGTLALSGTAGTGDVLSGKTFYNTALKTKRTGTMPNRGAVVITPSAQNQTILVGYHNGQGYVKGDTNLRAENIKEGVSIFGVAGSLQYDGRWATGTYQVASSGDDRYRIYVRGLAFRPRIVLVKYIGTTLPGIQELYYADLRSLGFSALMQAHVREVYNYTWASKITVTIYNDGFNLDTANTSYQLPNAGEIYAWYAKE